jgi:hypothetical protein
VQLHRPPVRGVAPGGPRPTYPIESIEKGRWAERSTPTPLHGPKTPDLGALPAISGAVCVSKRDTPRLFRQIHPLQVARKTTSIGEQTITHAVRRARTWMVETAED